VAGNTSGGGSPDLRPGTGTLSVDYSLIGDTTGITVAETLFSEDFESYADTAAMQSIWGAAGTATLNTLGNPGNSATYSGGTQNQVVFATPFAPPTSANPLVYSVDIYDDGISVNRRLTAGLRSSSPKNIFEMGMYNSPSHYAIRTALPGTDWLAFSNIIDDSAMSITNAPVEGWHTFQVVLDGSTATFTLDLHGDGNINATEVVSVAFDDAFPLDTIRMGTGLSSAGGGARFDNFLLQDTGLSNLGTGNVLDQPAMLGALANNGGPTQTHALLPGSPALDAGDPSIVFNPAEFDQRGAPFVRVFDDPVATGSGIDMGAYERQTVAVLNLTVDTNFDENDGDYSAGDLSLREAVGLANGSIGADTITFAAALSGQTITLGGTELEITETLTIDATALAQNVTIDANSGSRIFNITAAAGDFTLAGLTLTGGRTTTDGGGIQFNSGGQLTLDQSTVSGNSTVGFGARGGGILSSGDITLTNSTISGNSTTDDFAFGGGISSSGTVTLTSSTVSGNSTAGDYAFGGGIHSSGTVTLTSSTVSNNHADYSNAIGGGIWNSNGTITITNSIVAGNTAGGGSPDINPGSGIFDINFSLLGTAVTPDAGGSGNIFNNTPLLGPLADNGGPTQTHALLFGSPAIDAGDPAIVSPPSFDQRGSGFDRVRDGDAIPGAVIDIGAFELQAPIVPSADFNGSGFVTGLDFLAWQRGFGTPAPTAAKTDGDADNDGDVDGTDLGFWESQFGGPAPLAALSTVSTEFVQPGPPAASLEQTAPSLSSSLSATELINAALAWELALEIGDEEEPLLDNRSTASVASQDAYFATGTFAPTLRTADEIDLPATSSRELEEAEASWLSEELLERVFG